MRFEATQKVLTFLMAMVSAAPVILSGEVSTLVGAIFAAAVVAGWFIEAPLSGNARFRRVVTGVIILVALLQIGRAVTGTPIARVSFEFAVLLLGLKLCTRARFFDYQQIAILAFLNIIGATVTTYNISYAACFVGFVILCPPMLALAHLRNEMERRFRHDDNEEGRLALRRLLASRRVVSGRFVAGTGFLALPVLLVTVMLFVTFPRFGLGFMGQLPGGDSVAGFSAEVKLGDMDTIREEERVILRLEPLREVDERSTMLRLKLRGAAFDTYRDDTWKRSGVKSFAPMKHRGDEYRLDTRFVSGSAPGYEVLLEPLVPPYLFVPEGTGAIVTEPVAKSGSLRPRELRANELGVVKYNDPGRVGIRYRVHITGAPLPGPDSDSAAFLKMPEGTEALAALAREVAGEGKPRERVAAVVKTLKSRYKYSRVTTTPGAPPSEASPLDVFLFQRKTGTCEHFATAATLMLRAVGVPSRMVTGFGSAVWNPIGGYYAVQARSAHAWTEAHVDGRWISVDATPPEPEQAGSAGPSTMAMMMDAIRMRWHKHVVGYDVSSQMEMGKSFSRLWRGSGSGKDGLKRLPWKWIGLGVLVGIVGFWAWRRRRNLMALLGMPSRPGSGKVNRHITAATDLYRQLERRLADLGHGRGPNCTPLEHVVVLRDIDTQLAVRVDRITSRYNQVRFGGRGFEEGELVALREDIRKLG